MKYRYNTVTGNHEIEVDEQLHAVLQAMDREEYNSDRKYRRHNPVSLSSADYDGEWMEDETDVLSDLIQAESQEYVYTILAQLAIDQQILIERIFFNNEKIVDIARTAGVTEEAIRDRLRKIYKRLIKIID
jgi:DNA-directed RNA polymerase specialized sigma24 family protein